MLIAVDVKSNNLEVAKQFGVTQRIIATDKDWLDQIKDLTNVYGVDAAIDASGNVITIRNAWLY